MKEKKPHCQKKSVGFDLKLKIIDEVCNGQISVNHASVKYQVGRNAIYYWLQKFATLEQKQKGMSSKDEIKKLLKTELFAARTQSYCYLWSK